MSSLMKSDVFFFITSVAVVIFTVGLSVALIYVIKILRDMKELSQKAKDEGGKLIDDMRTFRESARGGGFRVANLLAMFGLVKKVRRKSSHKNNEEEI